MYLAVVKNNVKLMSGLSLTILLTLLALLTKNGKTKKKTRQSHSLEASQSPKDC